MVELLRYFIFFYCFLGVFISGGLFFTKRSVANTFLALFIFSFTLEQIDFLYTTSDILFLYPEYYLVIYPICFLFGPSLWLHFVFVQHPKRSFKPMQLLHFLPFVLFVILAMLPFYGMDGESRIQFTRDNFMSHMMPLNYLRTTHVAIYGLLMVIVIVREKLYQSNNKGVYLTIIAIIYFVTAVLQSYLTAFADSYRQFSVYFFLASSITLIGGFVLYRYPNILQELQEKYFSTTLSTKDRNRIVSKIKKLENDTSFFLNNELNLKVFCSHISEKSHQVSQVFSEDFKTSFTNFINKNRIEVAKEILSNPKKDDLKILAVAFECGFNNNVTFNKAFTKFTGVTPGKYRKDRA